MEHSNGVTTWRERLRTRLAASGKTRAQVCAEAGLNPAYLTQILEQKGATPRIDNLGKLAGVLGTSVSFLVDGVELEPTANELLVLFGDLSQERKEVALAVLRDMAIASH